MKKAPLCLSALLIVLALPRILFAQQPTASDNDHPAADVEQFVRQALERNALIKAKMHEVDAKQARVPQAGALPDPEIDFGQMNVGNVVPFTTLGSQGFSEVYIGISQRFPFYGERGLSQRMADAEVGAERWSYEFTRLQVIAGVKTAYYELFYWRKSEEILKRDQDLLDKFAKIAGSLYEVGKGTQADVLKAQTEITRIQDRIELAVQREQIAEAQLNGLLDRSPDTAIPELAPPSGPLLTEPLDQLYKTALANFPLLKRQEKMIDKGELSVQLAHKKMYPDFGFTFRYHNRGGLPDYWTIGGTAKVPLYFWRKQRKGIEEATAGLEAERQRYENDQSMLLYRLKQLFVEATTANKLTELYGKTVVPQDTLTMESTLSSYQVGKVEFLSVLDSLEKLLQDETEYWQNLTNYHKSLAQMEPYLGIELTK